MRVLAHIVRLLAWAAVFGGVASAWAERPARKLLDENRLEEAVAVCRQFEAMSSFDRDNFLDCAWVYYRTGRLEAGDKLLDKLRANYTLPEFQLVTAYSYIARKKFDKAKEALDSLASKHKGTGFGTRVQETAAERYEAMGNLDAAAFIYKQIIGEKPGSGIANWGLGRYYLARGDATRAKVHLDKTAQLWPKHLASRYNLAVLSISQENDREAAKYLAECYRLNKADAGVLEQLGALYERKGMLSEAIKYWQKALAINPKSDVANEKIARYMTKVVDKLIEAKQYKEALEQIEALTPTKKAAGPMLLRRGVVYRNLGKYDKALADLLKYTSENKPDGLAYRELGICYVNLKLLDQAGTNFLEATAMEPQNGINWAWLAFALEGKGEMRKARDAWRKAVELIKEPEELTKAARRLATIEQKLGKDKERDKDREREKPRDEESSSGGPQVPQP